MKRIPSRMAGIAGVVLRGQNRRDFLLPLHS
jgi:hypothetical protein